MSLKFGGIDLNSNVASVDRNDEGHEVSAVESTLSTGFSVVETLTARPLGVGGIEVPRIEGMSGDLRVSGEVKDSIEAFRGSGQSSNQVGVGGEPVDEGLQGRHKPVDKVNNVDSEKESVSRGDDKKEADVSTVAVVGTLECKGTFTGYREYLKDDAWSSGAYLGDSLCLHKIDVNEKEPVVDRCPQGDSARAEVAGIDSARDPLSKGESSFEAFDAKRVTSDELANSEMKIKALADKEGNQVVEVGVCHETGASQQTADRSNIVDVDLNVQIIGDVDRQCDNEWRNEVQEVSADVCIPFPAHFADNSSNNNNTASHFSGVGLNGNQDCENKEQVMEMTQPQQIEKRNNRPAVLEPECQRKGCRIEKEGEFYASDLVWGKVRSHPWWPGQIFDPSDSSEKAIRYQKKDSCLIAYFGDQSFAWNEASRIKPFQMHFSQMEKQSTSEAFCCAVDCALDEVSRRVEFGLACSCLSEEVYSRIKSQIIVNAGIREESRIRYGGDEFSSADAFNPVNLVEYLKGLAQSAYGGTDDGLEFAIARAQMLAFNRWKGYYQLPEFQMLDGSLENDVNNIGLGEREDSDEVAEGAFQESECDGKGKSIGDDSSRKRKRGTGALYPIKKEKCISDLMSGNCSNFPNGDNGPERKIGRKATAATSGKKRKAVDSIYDDSTVKARSYLSQGTRKPFRRIGESICKAASQLVSTPILKYDSQNAVGGNGSDKKDYEGCFGVTPPTAKKRGRKRKANPIDYPSNEMLSQLFSVARNPMKRHTFLLCLVSFFSDFRNSCLENSNLLEHEKSTEKTPVKQPGKKSSSSVTSETSGFEGMGDSYWTDRIIQSNTEEQVLFEPDKNIPTIDQEATLKLSLNSDSRQGTVVVSHELQTGKQVGLIDGKTDREYSPTALILNFMDLDSVPSVTNLNKIFGHYGPLNESETEVLKKSNRAKVVFKRRSDAETAFSSAGKFSIFGPSLVSYRLNYAPTPRKTPTSSTKGKRKEATFVEGNAVE